MPEDQGMLDTLGNADRLARRADEGMATLSPGSDRISDVLLHEPEQLALFAARAAARAFGARGGDQHGQPVGVRMR